MLQLQIRPGDGERSSNKIVYISRVAIFSDLFNRIVCWVGPHFLNALRSSYGLDMPHPDDIAMQDKLTIWSSKSQILTLMRITTGSVTNTWQVWCKPNPHCLWDRNCLESKQQQYPIRIYFCLIFSRLAGVPDISSKQRNNYFRPVPLKVQVKIRNWESFLVRRLALQFSKLLW